MERIKLNQPQAAQVQGGSYAAGIQRSAPVVPSRVSSGLDYLAMAIPTIGKVGAGIVDKVTQDAAVKGWVDGNANAITEQSWLTQDAYDRGQNIAQVSKAERGFTDEAYKELDDYVVNKTLDEFNQRFIQPYLTSIADKVRVGEIPTELGEKMMTQAMTTSATLQQEYAKRKQKYHQETSQQAMLNTTVALGDKLRGQTDPSSIHATLATHQEQLKLQAKQANVADVPSHVSKLMANIVKQQIVGADLMDDGTVLKLNAMTEYLATAQGGAYPEDVHTVQAAVQTAVAEAVTRYDSDLNVQLSNAKTVVALGGGLEDASVAALRNAINVLHARNPEKGAARYEELEALLRSANKVGFGTSDTPYKDRNARLANNQPESDITAFIAKIASGKPPETAVAMAVGVARDHGSPEGLEQYVKALWGSSNVVFTDDATRLDKTSPDVQRGTQTLNAIMAQATTNYMSGQDGLWRSLFTGAPPEQKEALMEWVKQYGANGTVFDAITHMPQIQRIAENFKMVGDTSKIKFDYSSSLWRSGNTMGARWFNEPNEQVLLDLHEHTHNVVRENRGALTARGTSLATEDGVLAAMREAGMLIAGTNAPIILQPRTRAAMRHFYGKEIPDDYIVDAVNKARNELASAKGVDPDDVYVRDNYNGSEIEFRTDKGTLARVRPDAFVSMIQVQQDNNIRRKGYVSTVMPQAATELAKQVGATVNKSAKGEHYTVKAPQSNELIPVTARMLENFSNPALGYTVISEVFGNSTRKYDPNAPHASKNTSGLISEAAVTDTARNVSKLARSIGLPPVLPNYAHPDTLRAYAALTASTFMKPAISVKYMNAMQMVVKDPTSVLAVANALNQNKDYEALPYAQRLKLERGLYAVSKLPK